MINIFRFGSPKDKSGIKVSIEPEMEISLDEADILRKARKSVAKKRVTKMLEEIVGVEDVYGHHGWDRKQGRNEAIEKIADHIVNQEGFVS